MLTNEMLHSYSTQIGDLPDLGWLSGFLGGLRIVRERTPAWRWKPFFDDMNHLVKVLGVKKATMPGESPPSGTRLAALGGYISVTGRIANNSLEIPLPDSKNGRIRRLLNCERFQYHVDRVEVPLELVDALVSQVKLDGPLLELIEEAEP